MVWQHPPGRRLQCSSGCSKRGAEHEQQRALVGEHTARHSSLVMTQHAVEKDALLQQLRLVDGARMLRTLTSRRRNDCAA